MMKVLLLSTHGFGHGSMHPFIYYASELRERFDVSSTEIVSDCLKEKVKEIKNFDGDLMLVCVPSRIDRHGILDFFIEAEKHKKGAKLVLFDYGDGNESKFWDVLPHVDLYLKQYLHRDMLKYQKSYIGASEFIEYLVRSGEVPESIESEVWTNLFQSHLADEHYSKVMLGWNFALWRRLLYLADGSVSRVLWYHDKLHKRLMTLVKNARDTIRRSVLGASRPIDVYCRATLYAGWTKAHRTKAINLLNELAEKYNVVSSTKKVGFSEYYREMGTSKIFVSPCGWCEYTPKDYEAMQLGAMLIKPSVEHIDTEPNVLFPKETYVPVKWDLSDLKEKCVHYLSNEGERQRIVQNAKEAISGYYRNRRFLDKFGEIVDRLGLR